MSEPLLQIRNHHAASSGDPPIVAGEETNVYIGYFENAFGEQWVFTFDRDTRRAVLRGGDIGWNTEIQVKNGAAEGVILRSEESAWLQACWAAATGP